MFFGLFQQPVKRTVKPCKVPIDHRRAAALLRGIGFNDFSEPPSSAKRLLFSSADEVSVGWGERREPQRNTACAISITFRMCTYLPPCSLGFISFTPTYHAANS